MRVGRVWPRLPRGRFLPPPHSHHTPQALCGTGGPRFYRKLYIPWREHPTYNFTGLIIGPRGNTQKRLERECNCKVAVRGRGATHEGKNSRNAAAVAAGVGSAALDSGGGGGGGGTRSKQRAEEDEDDMHVTITGERLSEVEQCTKLVADMLIPVEDETSEWKKLQLMELMAYNGQLAKMAEPCHACGEVGHRQHDCPHREAAAKRAAVRCALCGDASHVTSDCKLARGAGRAGAAPDDDALAAAGMNAEYLSFMAELGDESAKAMLDLRAKAARA